MAGTVAITSITHVDRTFSITVDVTDTGGTLQMLEVLWQKPDSPGGGYINPTTLTGAGTYVLTFNANELDLPISWTNQYRFKPEAYYSDAGMVEGASVDAECAYPPANHVRLTDITITGQDVAVAYDISDLRSTTGGTVEFNWGGWSTAASQSMSYIAPGIGTTTWVYDTASPPEGYLLEVTALYDDDAMTTVPYEPAKRVSKRLFVGDCARPIVDPVTAVWDRNTLTITPAITGTYTSLEVSWFEGDTWHTLPNNAATSHTYPEAGSFLPVIRLVQGGVTYANTNNGVSHTVTEDDVRPVGVIFGVTLTEDLTVDGAPLYGPCIVTAQVTVGLAADAIVIDWMDGSPTDSIVPALVYQHRYTVPGTYTPVAHIDATTAGGGTYDDVSEESFVITADDIAAQAVIDGGGSESSPVWRGTSFLRRRRVFAVDRGTPIPPTMPVVYALSFDGIDDTVELPAGIFPSGNNPWTVRVTSRYVVTPQNGAYFFVGEMTNYKEAEILFTPAGGWRVITAPVAKTTYPNPALQAGDAVDCTVTYDGATVRGYMNGVAQSGVVASIVMDLSPTGVGSLGSVLAENSFAACTLTRVEIYHACLSSDDVGAIYAGQSPSVPPVHVYDFQDGTGDVLSDVVGDAHGTIIGATWLEVEA